MARNFAQIVFLLIALAYFYVSRQMIFRLLAARVPAEVLAQRRHKSGIVNRYLFLTLKDYFDPFLFRINFIAIAIFSVCALLQLLIGWFSFAALFMKILNSLMIFLAALEVSVLSLIDNRMKFGAPFILYRPLPGSARVFASTIADAVLYVIVPILMILCNFLAL